LYTQPTPATLAIHFLSLQDFALLRPWHRAIHRSRTRAHRPTTTALEVAGPLFSPLHVFLALPRSPSTIELENSTARVIYLPIESALYSSSSSSYSNDCGFFLTTTTTLESKKKKKKRL
tara:strand:- start:190 stop:546 length:357 start_codon:yes stop_codon:yes gene_type:complete